MKQSQMAIMSIVAVAMGLSGFSLLEADSSIESAPLSTVEQGSMLGHIIVEVKDETGAIKQYMQTDNLITDEGLNCTPVLLFGEAAADITDCASTPAVFDRIALSTATGFGTGISDGQFTSQQAGSLAVGAPDLVDTATESSAGSGSVTDIEKTFTYTGNGVTVRSATLEDTTPLIFAVKDFDTAVTLNTNDVLTVTWQITLS
jgi:hypothetical protein